MNLINIIRADFYKIKGSYILAMTMISPFLIVFLADFLTFSISRSSIIEGMNPWDILSKYLFVLNAFMIPMVISLLCFQINNIENKANGYRISFIAPISRKSIYFSKICILLSLLTTLVLLIISLNLLSGFILQTINPKLLFNHYNIFNQIFLYYMKLYVTMISILFIQFTLSFFIRNILINTGFPLFFIVFGVFISTWTHTYIYPYAFGFVVLNEFNAGVFDFGTKVIFSSTIWSIFFLVFGFFLVININKIKDFFS